MSSKFWVAVAGSGTGTWDASTTTHWASTSGGTPGVAAPTTSDSVFFDANSGTGTVTLSGSPACASLDASASTIATFTGTGALACAGAFVLKTSLTISGWTGTVTLSGTGSSQSITPAGNSFAFSLTVNTTGSYVLTGNLIIAAAKFLTITAGGFDAGGFTVNIGLFSSNTASTRVITIGSGTWTITGNNTTIWNMGTITGCTLNLGNAIVCSYSGATGTRTIQPGAFGAGLRPSFNITAGTDIVLIGNFTGSLDYTGFAGQINPQSLGVDGNFIVPAGVTWTGAGASAIQLNATSGTKTINTNGVVIQQPLTFGSAGSTATWQLSTNLTVDAAHGITLTGGTLDAATSNVNVSCGTFVSSSTNTRAIKMGSGTWEITSTATATVWNLVGAGMTVTQGSSTIKIDGSTANVRTFSGGSWTYNNIWITNATSGGQVNFAGNNTFNDFKQQDATAQTIKFTANNVTTVTSWSAFGSATGLLTITSITAATHTITRVPPASGNIFTCLDYLSVSFSNVSPSFYAGSHSTNGGTNSGWTFSPCPSTNAGLFMMLY